MVVVPVIDTPFPFGITTVLEGMSMAKPVVVSDTDGLYGSSRTPHGHRRLSRDVNGLRSAIASLLADPQKRRQMGEQARQAAVERFGVDVYAGELARHLRELGAQIPNAGRQ